MIHGGAVDMPGLLPAEMILWGRSSNPSRISILSEMKVGGYTNYTHLLVTIPKIYQDILRRKNYERRKRHQRIAMNCNILHPLHHHFPLPSY